ncbi:AMP-binding protein [Streptomyces coffeae]|uniref:AMP-dependent synthetase/ligase domain-containing protein n=1 Tax=Streptomyces coffeae TaxID=621382 RepID=A0ABS1NFF1_9ACTN|nr:AMP-binding protein [Streptomyces coffeae]MBL1098620.1 hypothetical protein [Streptomyces coffeae]
MSTTQPIGRIIRELAERDPQRPAVTCGARTLTREQLDRTSNRLARAYAELGVQQGDFVTIALAAAGPRAAGRPGDADGTR